jgi:hypothetical protein
MKIVDAPTKHPSIRKLLALATSKEKVEIEYESYLKYPNRTLFACELEGENVGCIGVEIAYEYMKSKNVDLATAIEHNHWFHFKDPDGNHLNVCQC